MEWNDVIMTEEDLRAWVGQPSELVKNKTISFLDGHCRAFISQSPFLLLSTANANGQCDASPRGDAPGFVRVLDDHHLLIPDRPGNRRIDSLRNMLANPHVGLLFLIPGLNETLRINGRACIVKDESLLKEQAVRGRIPRLGIIVTVEECFVHCAKAFLRSRLWQPETWIEPTDLPNPAQILADHAALPGVDSEAIATSLHETYTKRLY